MTPRGISGGVKAAWRHRALRHIVRTWQHQKRDDLIDVRAMVTRKWHLINQYRVTMSRHVDMAKNKPVFALHLLCAITYSTTIQQSAKAAAAK